MCVPSRVMGGLLWSERTVVLFRMWPVPGLVLRTWRLLVLL